MSLPHLYLTPYNLRFCEKEKKKNVCSHKYEKKKNLYYYNFLFPFDEWILECYYTHRRQGGWRRLECVIKAEVKGGRVTKVFPKNSTLFLLFLFFHTNHCVTV